LAIGVLLASVVVAACGTNVDLDVVVAPSGAGSVTLTVAFPRSTAAQIVDLESGLPVADLRAAGWAVNGPRPGPEGTTVVSASHGFSDLGQLPALVGDVAGNGPEADRPFRLTVNEVPGFLQDNYAVSGRVNLQCSLSCFADPKLAARVGYALGMPSSEVRQLIGDPAKEINFRVEVVLPGQVTASNAGAKAGEAGAGGAGGAGGASAGGASSGGAGGAGQASAGGASAGSASALVWSPVLGETTQVSASSKVVDKGRVEALGIAVAAGALVVVVTAIFVVWSGRHRRRRYHRGGLRFR
jgi:hypothetical protein